MRTPRFLLLLLLMAATVCSAQRRARHRTVVADVKPVVPTIGMAQVPVVQEETLTAEAATENVAGEAQAWTAQPLTSQVQQAATGTWEAYVQHALDSLCQSPMFQTTQLGLCVYDLTAGQPLYAINSAHRMRPASCQKVITAVTALSCLKGNYQLRTDFRTTGQVSNRILEGDLIVVGGMDPLVTVDEMQAAAISIRSKLGIDSIAGSVIYDLSMREDAPYGWGWCWDDDYGPLSALLVDGRASFPEHWVEALLMAGIRLRTIIDGSLQKGVESKSVYAITHPIDQLLEPMMKKSDNIMAECLFYQTAAASGQKQAGQKQVARRTDELTRRLGLNPDNYVVADGSGLSLYNYTSAEHLVAMLRHAWQTPDIRQHLLPSLPIAGVDGTLKKRMTGTPAEGNVRAKTGTVTGVISLAGYLTTPARHTLAFAIINQGVPSANMARAFQDKVCQAMCSPMP